MFGDRFPLGKARFFLAIFLVYAYIQVLYLPELENRPIEMVGFQDTWIAYPMRCVDILGIDITRTNVTFFDNADYARREKYYISGCEIPTYSEPVSESKWWNDSSIFSNNFIIN